MRLAEVRKLAESIQGWLTFKEGKFLYNLARRCPATGVIVEIGSWKGRSSAWLGMGAVNGNKQAVYAVDPHTGGNEHQWMGPLNTLEEYRGNMRMLGLEGTVTCLPVTAQEAAMTFNWPIGVLFIDGRHDYGFVRLDYELWSPKLIAGGIIAFHDAGGPTALPGPKQVVEEFVEKSGAFIDLTRVDSIVAATKTG